MVMSSLEVIEVMRELRDMHCTKAKYPERTRTSEGILSELASRFRKCGFFDHRNN